MTDPAALRAEYTRRLEAEQVRRGLRQFDRAAYAAEMLERYDELDRLLVANGWPATSLWWREQVRRYFTSACKQVVFRVGRRGGKSSTFCRVAVVEVLHGRHNVPPGDVGYAAFISENRSEASARLTTIGRILDALKVSYGPIDGGYVLRGKNRGFRVYAARIGGVSGFTGIVVFCDEVAKWKDADTGVNPATEVLASVRPVMATMPLAKMVLSSSPMGKLDAHAAAFDEGDTEFQFTAHAATWTSNPTVTEADTRKLEPNEARRMREYGAVPMEGTEESLLSPQMLDRATRSQPDNLPPEPGLYYVATMDPGFTRNAWTFAITAKRYVGPRIKRSVVYTKEWRGSPSEPLNPRVVLGDIARICEPYGIKTVYTDQYERFGLGAIGQEPGIDLSILVPEWTAAKRLAVYESIETWSAADELDLPPDKLVRADLLGIRQRLTPNGFTIHLPTTPDGRHCDFAPTISMGLALATADPPEQKKESAVAERIREETTQHWDEVSERIERERHEREQQQAEDFGSPLG